MGSHFRESFAFFFDIESTYNTDPTIVVGDAMIITGEQPNPIAGSFSVRDFRRGGFYGGRPQVPVNLHQSFTFDTELTGTDEIATPIPPPVGKILRACGMDETLNAATDVTYAVQTDPAQYESGWGELYNGTNQWTFNAARGNATINYAENQFPTLSVNLMSKYTVPVASAAPGAPDLSSWLAPSAVSETFTTVCTLDGVAIELVSASFDLGMNVIAKDRPNVGETVIVTGVSGTGTISLRFDGITAKNWVNEAILNQKQMAFVLTQQNPAAGWRITQTCPQIQITGYALNDVNGEITEDLTVVIGGDSTNNPLTLVCDLDA